MIEIKNLQMGVLMQLIRCIGIGVFLLYKHSLMFYAYNVGITLQNNNTVGLLRSVT